MFVVQGPARFTETDEQIKVGGTQALVSPTLELKNLKQVIGNRRSNL